MADPKKGTGKKPKGSSRRLYTDENPKDTVKIKFATQADARAKNLIGLINEKKLGKIISINSTFGFKVKRINKPYARKIQILTVVEQRSKVAGKKQQAAIAKKCKMAIRRKHGKA